MENIKPITDEEKAELKKLYSWYREAPVMTLRSDLPTFAESAYDSLVAAVRRMLTERGLKGEEYGIHMDTFEILPASKVK